MTTIDVALILLRCLLLTIVIELIMGLILGLRDKKDIINLILVNIITNPIVAGVTLFMGLYYYRYLTIEIIIFEILAVVSEGFIYSKVLNFKKINPYVLSLILNLTSFLIGEIINKL